MKTIIIWVLVLAAILILFLWRSGDTAALPVQSQLDFGSMLAAENGSYDFGTISMKDGNVRTEFSVTNGTLNDIRVDSIVTSCMCTTAYIAKGGEKRGPFGMPGHGEFVPKANETIKAGEEWTIEVVFDPAAHGPAGAGMVERSVYIMDERGGALELKFTADVTL